MAPISGRPWWGGQALAAGLLATLSTACATTALEDERFLEELEQASVSDVPAPLFDAIEKDDARWAAAVDGVVAHRQHLPTALKGRALLWGARRALVKNDLSGALAMLNGAARTSLTDDERLQMRYLAAVVAYELGSPRLALAALDVVARTSAPGESRVARRIVPKAAVLAALASNSLGQRNAALALSRIARSQGATGVEGPSAEDAARWTFADSGNAAVASALDGQLSPARQAELELVTCRIDEAQAHARAMTLSPPGNSVIDALGANDFLARLTEAWVETDREWQARVAGGNEVEAAVLRRRRDRLDAMARKEIDHADADRAADQLEERNTALSVIVDTHAVQRSGVRRSPPPPQAGPGEVAWPDAERWSDAWDRLVVPGLAGCDPPALAGPFPDTMDMPAGRRLVDAMAVILEAPREK